MSSEIYYASVSYRAGELRQAAERQRRIREAVGAARALAAEERPGGERSGSRSRGRRSRRRQSAAACGC
jgi:hypothetical protein